MGAQVRIPLQHGAVQDDPYLRERGLDFFYQPSFGETLGAFRDTAVTENPVSSYFRYTELRDAREGRPAVMRQGIVYQEATEPDSPYVTADEANERAGHLGLSFDAPIPERALDIMMERKGRENQRNFVLARRSRDLGTTTAGFLTALAVSALDPLNVASAFVPVVGEARFALWAERLGKTSARLARGGIEGAVGAAIVEPIVYGAAQYEQADYTYLDSLINVGFGTVLGAGLHAGGGRIGDAVSARRESRRLADQWGPYIRPETHEAAMRASVGQMAEGRPVRIDPILRDDPNFAVRSGSDAPITDPFDPRLLFPEGRARQAPPAAREFDLGRPIGQGGGQRFATYTPLRAVERGYLDEIVGEMVRAEVGHRTFVDNPDGPGQLVYGADSQAPDWFRGANEQAAANRKIAAAERRKAAREGRAIEPGQFGAEEIMTKERVERVAEKLKNREPLGKAEADVARVLMDEVRHRRERASEIFLNDRAERRAREEAEIDRIAKEEAEYFRGERWDDEEAADVAAATSEFERVKGQDAETLLQDDIAEVESMLDALEGQGVLSEADARALAELKSTTEATSKWEEAARAAGRCLLLHP